MQAIRLLLKVALLLERPCGVCPLGKEFVFFPGGSKAPNLVHWLCGGCGSGDWPGVGTDLHICVLPFSCPMCTGKLALFAWPFSLQRLLARGHSCRYWLHGFQRWDEAMLMAMGSPAWDPSVEITADNWSSTATSSCTRCGSNWLWESRHAAHGPFRAGEACCRT